MEEFEKNLILFDFDGTIIDDDIAFTMLENTLNDEEYKSVTDFDKMDYAESMDKYYKLMKSKNKTMNDIHPILENIKFNDGIPELLEYIKKNKNKFYLILITGDDLYITTYFLKYKKYYDLFDYFIGIPASIDKSIDDQMVTVKFLPPHNCDFCDKSLCKTNEFLKFLDNNKEYKNSKIFYICDGWNDYCLSNKYLKETDYILARKGFAFWKLMRKEKYNKNIKSHIIYWDNGQEIIEVLKNNI